MNERIKELLEEAGVKYITAPDNTVYEKFAKLVILKCAHIATNAENNENEIRCMYTIITEHFGVKE